MVYRKKSNKLIDWIYDQYPKETIEKSKVSDGYETNNVWKIDPSHDKVHSAIFPLQLCDRVIKYYSFMGDLVFDPFAGSGTTLIAAKDIGFDSVGVEMSEEYCEIIKNRISQVTSPLEQIL